MTTSNATGALVEKDQKLLGGTQKDLANRTFTILDKPATAGDVEGVLQDRINKGLAVIAARAALKAAMEDFRTTREATNPFVSAFRSIVRGMFKNPATLADFGLEPRKSTKKTLDTKVAAVEKTKATREARGTKGTRQKAQIHGAAEAAPAGNAPAAPKP